MGALYNSLSTVRRIRTMTKLSPGWNRALAILLAGVIGSLHYLQHIGLPPLYGGAVAVALAMILAWQNSIGRTPPTTPDVPDVAAKVLPPLSCLILACTFGWCGLWIGVSAAGCGAPQLTPADRVEIVDHNVAIYHCQEAGREAGTYAAYDACMRDAGLRKDAGQ
jgi:hypothetical protein